MTISKIHSFLSIVETGSFSEAAVALYTTQATVSKHISSLEKELGFSLFDRSHRRPSLTHAGQIFYKYAQEFMRIDRNLKRDLNTLCGSATPSLSIASIPVMAYYGLNHLINGFQQTYSHIHITVEELETCDLLSALESHQVSLAFCRLSQPEKNDYERIDMYSERICAVLPTNHPLSGCSSISIRELEHETYLLLNKQTGLYDFCIALCRQHGGFFPKVAYTGNRAETIVDMVSCQMGITLLPELSAKYLLGQHPIACVPLTEDVQSTISFVRPRKLPASPASDLFWDFIKERFC